MTAPRAQAPARHGPGLWLLGMGSGALATLATPTAVLAGVLLAPGLLALLLDPTPGRTAARPVLLCGVAASLHPLLALWDGGGGMDAGLGLAADLPTLGTAWAAQGLGWLACELSPLAVALVQTARVRAQAARLRAERVALEEEWGLPPPT